MIVTGETVAFRINGRSRVYGAPHPHGLDHVMDPTCFAWNCPEGRMFYLPEHAYPAWATEVAMMRDLLDRKQKEVERLRDELVGMTMYDQLPRFPYCPNCSVVFASMSPNADQIHAPTCKGGTLRKVIIL